MKLARTFFLLFLTYTICWTPFAFLTTLDFAGHLPDPVYIFFLLLAHANSTVNVFLYGLTNSHFRTGYAQFLRLHSVCGGSGQTPNDGDPSRANKRLKAKAVKESRYLPVRCSGTCLTELVSMSTFDN
jgi:hypothetical protein